MAIIKEKIEGKKFWKENNWYEIDVANENLSSYPHQKITNFHTCILLLKAALSLRKIVQLYRAPILIKTFTLCIMGVSGRGLYGAYWA